ncbi:MAG: hypothetical protein ACREJU_18880 [Nitrospiraceae bacterium]
MDSESSSLKKEIPAAMWRTYVLARKQGVLPEGLTPAVMALKGIGDENNLYAVPPDLVARLTADAHDHRLDRTC